VALSGPIGEVLYRFDSGDGIDSDCVSSLLSDVDVQVAHSFGEPGTNLVRVKAGDPEGAESDGSPRLCATVGGDIVRTSTSDAHAPIALTAQASKPWQETTPHAGHCATRPEESDCTTSPDRHLWRVDDVTGGPLQTGRRRHCPRSGPGDSHHHLDIHLIPTAEN
jgi:hypothetical protein